MRLNFSHGSHEFFRAAAAAIRQAAAAFPPKVVAVALDTKGPEIRTGMVAGSDPNATFTVQEGSDVRVSTDPALKDQCGPALLYCDYAALATTPGIRVGGVIFVDDGLLALEVREIDRGRGELRCRARNSADLGSQKGMNLPGCSVQLPALSDKDKADLAFGVAELEIDCVFMSFIRSAEQVEEIREFLQSLPGELGSRVRIISKIENEEGLLNYVDILAHSDGVMVARGDMGIEIEVEKVFTAQKVGWCESESIGSWCQ